MDFPSQRIIYGVEIWSFSREIVEELLRRLVIFILLVGSASFSEYGSRFICFDCTLLGYFTSCMKMDLLFIASVLYFRNSCALILSLSASHIRASTWISFFGWKVMHDFVPCIQLLSIEKSTELKNLNAAWKTILVYPPKYNTKKSALQLKNNVHYTFFSTVPRR